MEGPRVGHSSGRAEVQRRRTNQRFLGRLAASKALFSIGGAGIAQFVIGTDPDGCPLWPTNITGSISHTGSVAVSAVAHTSNAFGVGVDVEQIHPRHEELAERVLLPSDVLKAPAGVPEHLTATVFFSVRESVFKCVFPTLRQPMDWPDCHVELDWNAAHFSATVWQNGPAIRLVGRFLVDDDIVASLCWWPVPAD